MTLSNVIAEYLDNSPDRVFSLWGLTDYIGAVVGWRVMPHTVRDACREYADRAGALFYCIDRKHSQYQYIHGCKIAGALTGRE
jgi:hypothetical protein